MTKITVVDAIMGAGKTTAAFNWMLDHPDNHYIFATQYIDECKRVQRACPDLHFILPEQDEGVTKSADLIRLILSGQNVTITHALLGLLSDDTVDVLRGQHYHLIMDEAFDVMHLVNVSEDDKALLMDSGYVSTDTRNGSMTWSNQQYTSSGRFFDIKQRMDIGGVVESEDERLMEWMYRPELFDVFDDIMLLTYMFQWSPMRFYCDIVGIEYQYVGVRMVNGKHAFCPSMDSTPPPLHLRDKIHVVLSPKRNAIGDGYWDLSKNWYKNSGKIRREHTNAVRTNMRNIQKAEWKDVPANDIMWSSFAGDIRHAVVTEVINGKRRHRFNGSFVAMNCRAKNDYGGKHHIAYLVNVFLPRALGVLLSVHGIQTSKELVDGYATSVMVQWIWRSAIRNGEEIWLYLPSSRMRGLLFKWMDHVEGKYEP